MHKLVCRKLNSKTVVLILIFGLLILRFPLLIIPSFYKSNFSHMTIFEIYSISTYILTMLFIFYNRHKLNKYNIDIVAVILLIIVPIITPLIQHYFSANYQNSIDLVNIKSIVAILFSTTLIFCNYNFSGQTIKRTLIWCGIGAIIGIITAFFLSQAYNISNPVISKSTTPVNVQLIITLFFTQANNAAISEEPLFRGFIWGYFKEKNYNEYWIIIIQAAIFGIGHCYYLPSMPVPFIGTFVVALIFGIIVYKSKSIASTIITHGIINSFGDIFQHFL